MTEDRRRKGVKRQNHQNSRDCFGWDRSRTIYYFVTKEPVERQHHRNLNYKLQQSAWEIYPSGQNRAGTLIAGNEVTLSLSYRGLWRRSP